MNVWTSDWSRSRSLKCVQQTTDPDPTGLQPELLDPKQNPEAVLNQSHVLCHEHAGLVKVLPVWRFTTEVRDVGTTLNVGLTSRTLVLAQFCSTVGLLVS